MMSNHPFNYHWIEDGRILAGSIPRSAADIIALDMMGISAVLRLTEHNASQYPGVAEWLNKLSMEECHAPIRDTGIPDEATLRKCLDFLDRHYAQGNRIYVHCRGGVGRTGTVLQAWYVLRRGYSVAQARAQLSVRVNPDGICAAFLGTPQPEFVASLEARRAEFAAG